MCMCVRAHARVCMCVCACVHVLKEGLKGNIKQVAGRAGIARSAPTSPAVRLEISV